ncbi:MAG TPA: wax ester/triacylglycerol synthase family O-acyltransferase [Actinomycetota bacterium]|nr:wax ester/triacylglycerol synthase family O-acyltransferase [Actinomycetota bacterium]
MRRLSGQDDGFLLLELPEQPMQTIVLAVLRPGPEGPVQVEAVRRHMAARLHELPAFRWRVVPVPLGLSHPLFVEDPDFEVARHVRHAVLPEPGGDGELESLCARLAEQRLDRGRPLWQMTLVDGLAGGRQAIVLEIHHALMDGFATLATLARIFSGSADPALDPARGLDGDPGGSPGASPRDRLPGGVRLVAGAIGYQARVLVRLPGLVATTRRGAAAVKQRRSEAAVKAPDAGVDTPLSTINRGFTAERRYARTWLPLEEVRRVKEAAGVTVNDVVLAVVAGALRSYLEARGELPGRPLVASVPVGMEDPGAPPRVTGNRFSRLTTSLATDVADPWTRLATIAAVTREAKVCLDLAGRQLLADWLEYLPPLLGEPAVRRVQAARHNPGTTPAKLDANVVVSNVRGPPEPWQFGSAVVEEMYLAGPPNGGVGVTIVAWDYAGRLLLGLLSFADSVEDPGELTAGLHRGLAELVEAAERAALTPDP